MPLPRLIAFGGRQRRFGLRQLRLLYVKSQFVELLDGYRCRSLEHEIDPALVLRERNHVANTRLVGDDHRKAVDPHRDAAVRWCAVFQRVEDRPEALGLILHLVPHEREDAFLFGAIVNADTPAAEFVSIPDEVVLLGPNGARIGVEQMLVLGEVTRRTDCGWRPSA